MEPWEAKDVMVRLGKVEAQLRTVTQRLSGLASQKDLDELRRKNQALEASARRLEELEGAARDADARLRQQKGRAEVSNAELGRKLEAFEKAVLQKVEAAANRADDQ